jgi:hypothetical protein
MQCFGGTYHFHLLGLRVSQAGGNGSPAFVGFLVGIFFDPENENDMFLQNAMLSMNYIVLRLNDCTLHGHCHEKK